MQTHGNWQLIFARVGKDEKVKEQNDKTEIYEYANIYHSRGFILPLSNSNLTVSFSQDIFCKI